MDRSFTHTAYVRGETVTATCTVNLTDLEAMIAKAATNKGRKAKDGPLTVTLPPPRQLAGN